MARDLIPPRSPVDRPPAALDPGTPRLIELPPDAPEPPPQPAAPSPSRFRNRFGFLIGALGGVFIVSVLLLVLIVSTSDDSAALEPNWSSWQPSDTSLEGGATQIAEKVGAEYRHPDGKQLALVTGRSLDATVALRSSTGAISLIEDAGVVYKLDGLGPNGSILGGTPSVERLKLVQREALELALYTFRYLPDVKQVVTLLPPPPPTDEEIAATNAARSAAQAAQAASEKASKSGTPEDEAAARAAVAAADKASTTSTPDPVRNATFHRPGDLLSQLQMPLEVTLPGQAPSPESLSGQEVAIIDLLTSSNLFKWSLPSGSALLVLDR